MKRIVKVGDKEFRYNFRDYEVEYVIKLDDEMRKDNVDWRRKYGTDLWDADVDGYMVVDSAGLRLENWLNAEIRKIYLAAWGESLDEELGVLERDAIKEFAV